MCLGLKKQKGSSTWKGGEVLKQEENKLKEHLLEDQIHFLETRLKLKLLGKTIWLSSPSL